MIKKADKMFQKLGFVKIEEDKFNVTYDCCPDEGTYIQRICILHKSCGYDKKDYCIIQSYDPCLFDEKKIGNTNVGLTFNQMKACIRKVKELGW